MFNYNKLSTWPKMIGPLFINLNFFISGTEYTSDCDDSQTNLGAAIFSIISILLNQHKSSNSGYFQLLPNIAIDFTYLIIYLK